ncbi:FxLYD domain-containing protein [Natrinema sp. CGMCC1.2065]|uniref:FxLYD domain-containing protein n=1 Tax=Natrinema sp. CGMCC1.2065 TaxID=3445767 RepID=UPI003F4A1733
MQRRDLLLGGGVALSATIAGCSSDGTDSSDGESGNGNSSDDGAGSDWERTELLTEGSDLGLRGSGRLTKEQEEIGWEIEDAYVDAYVDNEGSGPSGTATVRCTWYDESGGTIGTDTTEIATIAAGETWKARVYHHGTDPGAVEGFDLEVVDETPAEPVNLDVGGMTVANVDRYFDETGVRYTAGFTNERDEPIESVYAVLKLYEDEFLLNTEVGHLEDFPAGETKSGYPFDWKDRRADAVNDREFLFADGVPSAEEA